MDQDGYHCGYGEKATPFAHNSLVTGKNESGLNDSRAKRAIDFITAFFLRQKYVHQVSKYLLFSKVQ